MPAKLSASLAVVLVGLFLLAACTGATVENRPAESQPEQPAESTVEEITTNPTAPPAQAAATANDNEAVEATLLGGTNIAQHSVPLEDIHFDLFNGSSLPLSRITEATLLNLRDAIPPIEKPVYETVEAADAWLTPDDLVIGYVDGEEALAYPVRILNYHEIVNETVNNAPVLISYCPLCSSGIVYDRRLNGEVLEFGNTSALYNSDMVMYDRQTLSYWFQVEGEAIVGDLTGQRLEVLPTRYYGLYNEN